MTFRHYDALSVLEDLSEALREHKPARDQLAKAKAELGQAAPEVRHQLLEEALVDLLAGPKCLTFLVGAPGLEPGTR